MNRRRHLLAQSTLPTASTGRRSVPLRPSADDADKRS
jgi:hypothetical protein